MNSRATLGIGSLMLSVSIALGAMGAHGLEGAISPKYLGIWNTASLYFALNAVFAPSFASFCMALWSHNMVQEPALYYWSTSIS